MEANELRIGNYVFNPVQKKEVKVDLPLLSDVLYDEHIDRVIEDRFQPIPLTEEWLIKFGFENDEDDSYSINYKGVFFHH